MKPSEFRRIRRGTLDMTQGELAARLGITIRTITAIENAPRDVEPRYELAIRYLAERAQQPAE